LTDFDGVVVMPLLIGENQYKFKVKKDNRELLESIKFKIEKTSYTFKVTLAQLTTLQDIMNFKDIPHNLTYNNETKIIAFQYCDSQNISSRLCMKVTQYQPNATIYLHDFCSNNQTGTIAYNISNHLNGSFQAMAYGYTQNPRPIVVAVLDILDAIEMPFKLEGLFFAFLMVLIMVGLALSGNPAIVVIAGLVGVIFAVITKMWLLGLATVISLVFIGILYLVRARF
jgi:hypothetical protein